MSPRWADNVAAGVPEEDFENNVDGIDLTMGVPDDIQLTQIKENDARHHATTARRRSAPTSRPSPATPQYEGRFFSTADSSVDYGIFRTDKAPFDDVALRQAVNYAVDRDAIIRIYGGELSRKALLGAPVGEPDGRRRSHATRSTRRRPRS